MALAHVQSRGVDSVGAVSSLALAFLSDLTAGNMIVAHGFRATQTGTMSMADTIGHTFTQHANSPVTSHYTNASAGMWWNVNATGGADTATLTMGATVTGSLVISEYSGQEQSGQPDVSGFNTDDSAAGTSGLFVTSVTTAIVGLIVLNNNNQNLDEDPPAVERYTNTPNADDPVVSVTDRVHVTAGTYSLSWTIAGPLGYGVLYAAFKVSTAGPPEEPMNPGSFDPELVAQNWF